MSESWATSGIDLHLDLDPRRPRASIETALRQAVRDGRLSVGARIPASRALAADLGIARNTVAEAYAQLVAEGWLVAQQGSGTRVAARPTARAEPLPAPTPARLRYDLRPGRPDVNAFPRRAWLQAARRALEHAADRDLDYGDAAGMPALRIALAEYLSRTRGVRVGAEQVVVCAGFTQALSIVAGVLRARGVRQAAVEAYGVAEHRDLLRRAGLRLVPTPVDDAGLRTDALPATGVALVTPAHQFPLGVVLAPRRRADLIDWAGGSDGWIIEDDYDGEFRFDRRPVRALQALDPERVIYAGTASKTLAPGLRLAWLVTPPDLLDEVLAAKRADPAGSSAVDQLTLAELLVTGAYDQQVRRARLSYRRRRDQLVAVLQRAVPDCRIGGIAAGLHAVVGLPPGRTESDVVSRADELGLAVLSLGEFACDPDSRERPPALVVGFATPAEHAFDLAVARLVTALRG